MLFETIIKPALFAGVPLFVLSFLLVYWAIKHDYISVDDEKANLKKFKQDYKQQKSDAKINKIHKKWLYFGGGFYGLMGFITYVHVEVAEVVQFFADYTTLSRLIDEITISALISLVIESFLNLIPAFTWFLYWPNHIDMQNGIFWLLAAYFGYQLGSKFAQQWVKQNGLTLFDRIKRFER